MQQTPILGNSLQSIFGIAFAMSLSGVACSGTAPKSQADVLGISRGATVVYQCDEGIRLVASYFSLSDDSLGFVKLVIPDGKEYTLPNVLSASGARFTDDREVVWWTKGSTGFVQIRGENGQWHKAFGECKLVDAAK